MLCENTHKNVLLNGVGVSMTADILKDEAGELAELSELDEATNRRHLTASVWRVT